MPNNYYTNPALFIQGDIIRPEDVDAEFNLLEGAFDQLPTQVEIKTGSANYAVDTGVADAYVVDLPYVPTLADGLEINFKAANASTGSSTLNVNSTGVKAVIHPDGTSVIADTISAGGMIQVRYNGASYVMVSVGKGYMEQVTAANVALTNADVVLTNADVVLTNADAITTNTNVTDAQAAQTAAELAYDNFDDRWLGDKASDPTLDNDGQALLTGAAYFNTGIGKLKLYNGASWALTAPSDTDQAAINVVAGDVVYVDDLGSIADAVDTSSGNSSIHTVATNITAVQEAANVQTMTATATDVAAGGNATASYNSATSVMTIGVVTGATGPQGATGATGGGLTDVVNDTTPQLGAALDGQNFNLTNIGTISGSNLQLDFGGLT